MVYVAIRPTLTAPHTQGKKEKRGEEGGGGGGEWRVRQADMAA